MNIRIISLGIIDQNGKKHYVDLEEGLNVITGRSSTGKSALISIFDYCMGHSTNNIPRGVISDKALYYFCILKMPTGCLILGRKHDQPSKAFFKSESTVMSSEDITLDFFNQDYFVTQDSFRDLLGRSFGLEITDTDEESNVQHKQGRPSVRNMMSFMLQPQNLVANNMGLFYRFDDYERRDKVISEFNIFLGLVDQRYYLLKQNLSDAKKKLRRLGYKKEELTSRLESSIENLEDLRGKYVAITGKTIFPGIDSEEIISAPAQYLQYLELEKLDVNETSNEYTEQYEALSKEKNHLLGKRRQLVLQYQDLSSTIASINSYKTTIGSIHPVQSAYKIAHNCPFCNAQSESTQLESNALQNAINWLNSELRNAPSLARTYLPEQNKIDIEIKKIDTQIAIINARIQDIRRIGRELMENISLEKQGLTVRYQISSLLRAAISLNISVIDSQIESTQLEIETIETELKERYDVEAKVNEIEREINSTMDKLASKLSFEDEYKPLSFHFDTKKFSLYSERKGERVYLSSMGSAANWLYSHLCLFLSLMRLFIIKGDKCLIPPILFIDQPSQVYFPTLRDTGDKFDAEILKDNGSEDLNEVENMFIQILDFLKEIKIEYDWIPQIIITEHADGLDLGEYNFDDYVRKRWRNPKEGLINLPKENVE